MKQSNNYFQKIALALVASILVLIPNLHVYSSVGSYQRFSSVITANANYKKHPCSYYYSSVIGHYIGLYAMITDDSNCGYPVLSFKNKNYAKYDFSGFDN